VQSPDDGSEVKSTRARFKKLCRTLTILLVLIVLLAGAYLCAACLVFDFSKPAFPFNQNNSQDGRPVAFGPRPRERFCLPHWEGVYWKGDEWPFIVFSPICHWWCDHHCYMIFKNEK